MDDVLVLAEQHRRDRLADADQRRSVRRSRNGERSHHPARPWRRRIRPG
jgi:hypothetical protein